MTINELAERIIKISNKNIKINYFDKRDGDIEHSILDNTRLLNIMNIQFTNINDGLYKLFKTLI